MTELLKALTSLANEAAEYLRQKNGAPTFSAAEIESAMDKTEKTEIEPTPVHAKRGRKPKAAKETVESVEAPENESLNSRDAAKILGEAKHLAELTPAESEKAAQDIPRMLMKKFDKLVNEKPEGYWMARRILNEDFKVAKIADLTHVDRIRFIGIVKNLMENEVVGEPEKETAGIGI